MDKERVDDLAAQAYGAVAKAIYGESLPPAFSDLPEELQKAWYLAVVCSDIYRELPEVSEQAPVDGTFPVSVAWEVEAGLANTEALLLPELKKQIWMTGDEYSSPSASAIFTWKTLAALSYALTLIDPSRVNYVAVKWLKL